MCSNSNCRIKHWYRKCWYVGECDAIDDVEMWSGEGICEVFGDNLYENGPYRRNEGDQYEIKTVLKTGRRSRNNWNIYHVQRMVDVKRMSI